MKNAQWVPHTCREFVVYISANQEETHAIQVKVGAVSGVDRAFSPCTGSTANSGRWGRHADYTINRTVHGNVGRPCG